jgi:hypothetical protein
VDQVLGRALAKNPAVRYPSCGAFTDALRAALGVGPYSVPSAAPVAGAPVAGGPVTGAPVAGGSRNGAAGAGAPRLPLKAGGRWRGVLAAASAVAVLAGAAAVAAVVFHPWSARPQRILGGQATGQASVPMVAVSAAGEAGRASAGGSAVTGQPVRFTNPGSVPPVAAVFRSDGSLVTVGVNDTAYIWDVTARQETSEMAAPRGDHFQRAAFSPVATLINPDHGAELTSVALSVERVPATLSTSGTRPPARHLARSATRAAAG